MLDYRSVLAFPSNICSSSLLCWQIERKRGTPFFTTTQTQKKTQNNNNKSTVPPKIPIKFHKCTHPLLSSLHRTSSKNPLTPTFGGHGGSSRKTEPEALVRNFPLFWKPLAGVMSHEVTWLARQGLMAWNCVMMIHDMLFEKKLAIFCWNMTPTYQTNFMHYYSDVWKSRKKKLTIDLYWKWSPQKLVI